MAFRIFKTKSDCLINLSGIVYIATAFYLEFFSSFDLMAATETESLHHWLLGAIRDASLIIALSAMTITGIRSLRRDGVTIRRCVSPASAILLCLSFAGVSLYGHITISQVQRDLFYFPEGITMSLRKHLDQDELSLPQRSKLTLMYARNIYEETGEIVDYVTVEGKMETYQPSFEEKEHRKTMDRAKDLVAWCLKGLKRAYLLWPVFAIISIAIGLFTPIRRGERPD